MKYFNVDELCYSNVAVKNNIDNSPNKEIINNLNRLIDTLLDPIRKRWEIVCKDQNLGTPAIRINSGYRCEELNKAVGGSKTSAHLSGYAADIFPVNGKMEIFQDWIKDEIDNYDYDQIIFEKVRNGIASWIHIGLKNNFGEQRKQKFTII